MADINPTPSPADVYADCLGRPIVKGDWVTIDEGDPVEVLGLYGSGQFVYAAADGSCRTYFCCCVKRVSADCILVKSAIKPAACTTSADTHWQAFMDAAGTTSLNADTIAQLGRGAALLLRVARVSMLPDALAAQRWLSTMVYTAALVGAASEDVQ